MSERQYVGIDLHRRRSVIVRVDRDGKHLSTVWVPNGAIEEARAVEEAGPNPEVVLEATYGYYWLVDLLEELGATIHLANRSGLNWRNRRVKNDERDALDLVKKLRLGERPEAWIPPPAVRESPIENGSSPLSLGCNTFELCLGPLDKVFLRLLRIGNGRWS